MLTSLTILGFLAVFCLVAALCGPARDTSRRFTRRDGQAVSFAFACIVASSLAYRYAPTRADTLLIFGGLILPPLVAAAAGRRFLLCGFLTVVAGLLFQVVTDALSNRVAFTSAAFFDRYSFAGVMLGLGALATCNYLKQYMEQKGAA